jgi:hypothetical protein
VKASSKILQKLRAEPAPGKYTSERCSSSDDHPFDGERARISQLRRPTCLRPARLVPQAPLHRGFAANAGAQTLTRRALFLTRRAVLVTLLGGLGCGSRSSGPPTVLPAYGGEQAALFSDLFRPELFGIEGATPPENEGLLPERWLRADSVLPVRIVTTNRETRGEVRNYTVVAEPTADTLRGRPMTGAVTLTVADRSPAFAWLDGTGDKWVGTRLLLFLRYYEDGPHFYGTVDNAAVRAALARVKLDRAPPRAD